MKVQIMVDGVGAFREAFERYVNSASAKKVSAKKKAPAKKKAAAKKKTAAPAAEKDGDFDALVQSDCWQEMSMLKKSEPDIWQEESGGKEPRTIPACMELVDRINALLEVSKDIPG